MVDIFHIHRWSNWSELYNKSCVLYTQRICNKCNLVERKQVNVEHNFGKWTSVVTKRNQLLQFRICDKCGFEETELRF